MPVMFVRAYAEKIPELDAEQMLHEYDVGIHSSGWAKAEDVRSFVRRLQRIASPGPREPLRAPTAADAAAMGIPVARGPRA